MCEDDAACRVKSMSQGHKMAMGPNNAEMGERWRCGVGTVMTNTLKCSWLRPALNRTRKESGETSMVRYY